MTLANSTLPERAAPASVDGLVNHLRSLNISDSATTAGDVYLTVEAINSAFEVLAGNFLMIQSAFENPATQMFIAPTWSLLKTNLVTALCGPYKNIVAKVDRLTSEVSQLQTANVSITTEATILRQLNASITSEVKILRQSNASMTSEVTILRQRNTSISSEIAILRQTNSSEIALLRQINTSQATQLSRAISRTTVDEKELKSLKARCDELEKSRDYFSSETLRLAVENSDLKSQRVKVDGVPATGTRTQTWNQVMDDPNNKMDAILPLVPDLIIDAEVQDLSDTKFVKEPKMYERVQKCFAKHLDSVRTDTHPGSLLFDSHNIEVIGPLKPDMSLVTAACSFPTVGGMIAPVELKVGKLNKDSFGQLYDYLKGIKAAQPNRRIIIGLLSNLQDNHFLVLECNQNSPTRCTHYQSVSLAVALTYLRDLVIPDAVFHPPASVFTSDLGPLDQHLGNPAYSIVGVFPVPPAISTSEFAKGRWVDPEFVMPYGKVQMVVKRTTPGVHGATIKSRAPRTVQNEIHILLRIRELAQAENPKIPNNLPQILYHNNGYDEFGILPRGYPVHPSDGGVKWGKIISDVLDALAWLHSHKIIHRDVRLDNIIWDIDHAVLIDLGTAVDLARYRGTTMCYNGGYVCCPPSMIGDLGRSYQPTPADDCLAVVLLVNTVLFPARWQSFRSVELEKPGSPETRDLGRFWEKMEKSPMWRPFWKAAKEADYLHLKRMEQFFVHL